MCIVYIITNAKIRFECGPALFLCTVCQNSQSKESECVKIGRYYRLGNVFHSKKSRVFKTFLKAVWFGTVSCSVLFSSSKQLTTETSNKIILSELLWFGVRYILDGHATWKCSEFMNVGKLRVASGHLPNVIFYLQMILQRTNFQSKVCLNFIVIYVVSLLPSLKMGSLLLEDLEECLKVIYKHYHQGHQTLPPKCS